MFTQARAFPPSQTVYIQVLDGSKKYKIDTTFEFNYLEASCCMIDADTGATTDVVLIKIPKLSNTEVLCHWNGANEQIVKHYFPDKKKAITPGLFQIDIENMTAIADPDMLIILRLYDLPME